MMTKNPVDNYASVGKNIVLVPVPITIRDTRLLKRRLPSGIPIRLGGANEDGGGVFPDISPEVTRSGRERAVAVMFVWDGYRPETRHEDLFRGSVTPPNQPLCSGRDSLTECRILDFVASKHVVCYF